MALVMLPCDLPWWGTVQKHLKKISSTKNTLELIEGMQKIHDLCNVSLDPDEDIPDPQQFTGLLNFLDNDLTSQERSNFLNNTLPIIARRASNLKQHKPKSGLHFSLQQQPDVTELPYDLVSSLLANAFFSTYPKRTHKTHPTLQDFNFSYFFKHLNTVSQKAKLRSILYYFDWLDQDERNSKGCVTIMRQVMGSKEWLTIEDWLECSLPLCPLVIKHEGRFERAQADGLQICFASTKIGKNVLNDGNSQECMTFSSLPELLCLLLNIESLEDNEVVTVEGVRRVTRITDPKNKATVEKIEIPEQITICCVDAEDYSKLPLSQYEEDNVLRELNKCLLGYQQKQTLRNTEPQQQQYPINKCRRLSPIGESVSLGSNHNDGIPLITQQSCSTNRSRSESPIGSFSREKLHVHVDIERGMQNRGNASEAVLNNRRGRFIVLGSSGECLPVKRRPLDQASLYSSCESSDDEFHSAKTSVDDGSEDEEFHKRYSLDLETPERRLTFAERLKEALRRETSSLDSSESSYAVGIAVAGAAVGDKDIKVRRRGSTGFMLQEDSLDDEFLKESLDQERQWIDKFKNKQGALSRKESNKSSEYSFSTDYSSELEEVYEQFSRWLNDPILETEKGTKRTLDARDLAIVQFAGSILKRTLSESFAGVPLTDGCEPPSIPTENNNRRGKMVLNAKSLSLELARHKHRLAAQLAQGAAPIHEESDQSVIVDVPSEVVVVNKKRLNWAATCVTAVVQTLEDICVNVTLPSPVVTNRKLSQIAQKTKDGLRPVCTGNWGCGSSKHGEVQLKVIIQWLAASVSGVPSLIYYTCGQPELASLDTLYRILRDRKWTVKQLTEATLRYSTRVIEGRNDDVTLLEELIGVERKA